MKPIVSPLLLLVKYNNNTPVDFESYSRPQSPEQWTGNFSSLLILLGITHVGNPNTHENIQILVQTVYEYIIIINPNIISIIM